MAKNQVKVYITLLEIGTASISTIARKAQVDRTNCYQIMTKLTTMGLIFEIVKNKTKWYYPSDPRIISDLAKQKYENIQSIMPQLIRTFHQTNYRPHTTFRDGYTQVEDMLYQHLPKRQESMRQYDNTMW